MSANRSTITLVNRAVLQRINREVSLRASRFANALLIGAFRAIFRVEKAYEFTEPDVFQLDQSPDQILWSRLSESQLSRLPLALINNEILTARYQVFTEYDFIVVADLSQSMMLDWWLSYGGPPARNEPRRQPPTWKVMGDRTKLYLLKYTLASFIHAAAANGFYCKVLLVGNNRVVGFDSRQQPDLEDFLLGQMDAQCGQLATTCAAETPRICEALRQVLALRRRCIVLCVSDFRDTLAHVGEEQPRLRMSDLVVPLAEISASHRLLVLQINERRELQPQVEEIRVGVKNCPYVNGEVFPDNRTRWLSDRVFEPYEARASQWYCELGRQFRSLGIRLERLVAGRDDEQVDKKICELGISTGA